MAMDVHFLIGGPLFDRIATFCMLRVCPIQPAGRIARGGKAPNLL
jgi:hypothetical protein